MIGILDLNDVSPGMFSFSVAIAAVQAKKLLFVCSSAGMIARCKDIWIFP